MLVNFDDSLRLVLKTEGGYSNNKRDPGGPTYKGITLATGRAYIDPTLTATTLQKITYDQIAVVYRVNYADRIRYDALPAGLDYASFDYAVNSGYARVNRVLRQLVGSKPGTNMDAATLALIAARDPIALINALCKERLAFMRGLSTWTTFGKGWTTRVNGVQTHSLALAHATTFVPNLSSINGTDTLLQAANENGGNASAKPKTNTAAISTTSGGLVAAAGGAAHSFHVNGYGGMAIAACVVGALAFVIYLSERNTQIAAVTPAPGTAVVPALAHAA